MDDELLEKIGEKLKQLRIDAGYTSYEKFAWDNDINRTQYWKIEKGKTNLTLKSLMKVLLIHKMGLLTFLNMVYEDHYKKVSQQAYEEMRRQIKDLQDRIENMEKQNE